MEGIFWPGIVAMVAMYVLVFLVGVLASRGRSSGGEQSVDELLLAGRSLPLWVGFLTMTATWVGGGYINGTAEFTFSSGVVWGSQAGLGYAVSLLLGGLFYARRMRRLEYTTLVDPFEVRFGRGVALVLTVPAVLAEVFWSAAILVALGSTFGTVVGLDLQTSILTSATVAVLYTMFGGLRAVAYTDVVQLGLIVLGLGVAIPFAVNAAGGSGELMARVTGALGGETAFGGFGSLREGLSYVDFFVLLMLGGIPWNVYFQRVLSAPSPRAARFLSVSAAVLCACMAIPPVLLGLSGRAIDWTSVAAAVGVADTLAMDLSEHPALVLPYLLRYAVPTWIGVLGLGAIAAAVMSSVDSSILSASSLVAWNGYKRLIRPRASAAEVTRLVRVLVLVIGAVATIIALTVESVAALWYLCGDVVYTVLFAQLTLALFDPKANRVGALSGVGVAIFLRLGGGDTVLGLPGFLPYPDWSPDGDFPFRFLAMAGGLVTSLCISRVTGVWDPPRALRPLEPSP